LHDYWAGDPGAPTGPAQRTAMSIVVGLHHATRYEYDRPVRLGPQAVRLRPAPHGRALISSYALTVEPAQHSVHWQQDPYANWLARFVFRDKTAALSLAVDLEAEIAPRNPFDFFLEPYAETWPFTFPPELREDVAPFLNVAPTGAHLNELVRSLPRGPQNTVDFLVVLNRRLRHLIRYVTRLEDGVQTPEETLASGVGSCRDTAWLLVQVLRHAGLPARFVSGYLIELAAEATPHQSDTGSEHDRAALHAWTEVYLPGAGWIGLDATSGLLCGEGHVPLAATPHYRSAAPVSGTVEPCEVRFSHHINVRRIAETADRPPR
jgi:transglutaminase-like putative cysteine protease